MQIAARGHWPEDCAEGLGGLHPCIEKSLGCMPPSAAHTLPMCRTCCGPLRHGVQVPAAVVAPPIVAGPIVEALLVPVAEAISAAVPTPATTTLPAAVGTATPPAATGTGTIAPGATAIPAALAPGATGAGRRLTQVGSGLGWSVLLTCPAANVTASLDPEPGGDSGQGRQGQLRGRWPALDAPLHGIRTTFTRGGAIQR